MYSNLKENPQHQILEKSQNLGLNAQFIWLIEYEFASRRLLGQNKPTLGFIASV